MYKCFSDLMLFLLLHRLFSGEVNISHVQYTRRIKLIYEYTDKFCLNFADDCQGVSQGTDVSYLHLYL